MRATCRATCQDCDRSPAEGARFAGLSRTRCTDCTGRRRARSAERHAILRPPPAGVVDTNQPTTAAHLRWIRARPCAVRSNRCPSFATHAHHVRIGGTGGGMGFKPGDEWTVPLCALHHDELHLLGQVTFDRRHGLVLRDLAQALAARSPHLNSPLTE